MGCDLGGDGVKESEKGRVRMEGEEQEKERVMRGDDVNEREVWKQRFISLLEYQTQYQGRGETKSEGRGFRQRTKGCRVDIL